MTKTVIVTGVPGTGKTTVCNLVMNLARQKGVEAGAINFGTVMMDIIQKQGKTIKRDDMRKADLDFQRALQRKVATAILEKTKSINGRVIIDTHMAIKTPEGYFPGLPHHVLQLLEPAILVLVEAQPEEIASRRRKGAGRERDDAAEEAIKEELLYSRLMTGACAVLTGAAVKIVINAEGEQEKAAEEILKVLGVP